METNQTFNSEVCKRNRCTHCARINTGTSFTSRATGNTFELRHNMNCKSENLVYLITCKKCSLQYVGQTTQQVSKRMNSHKFDICNFVDPAFASNVAIHFNSENHSLNDFSFMPIDIVKNNFDRLCKETFWMHKLKTFTPDGMNSKLLFTVD